MGLLNNSVQIENRLVKTFLGDKNPFAQINKKKRKKNTDEMFFITIKIQN